jgi:transposase
MRGEKTLSQLGSQYTKCTRCRSPSGGSWRRTSCPSLFVDGRRKAANGEVENTALFEEIGRLKVELDWLKKQSGCPSLALAETSSR